jgi:hypothetical protein
VVAPPMIPYHGESQFKYMREVGFVPKLYLDKIYDTPDTYPIDPIVRELTNHEPKSAYVRRTLENTKLAITGYDREPKIPNNDDFNLAVEYLFEFIRQYIPIHKPEYENLFVNMKSAPGYPANLFFDKKGEIPDEIYSMFLNEPLSAVKWLLNMKKEMLPKDKIKANKMRSYVAGPVFYLLLEKIFSQTFNEHFKKVPLSAYGFNYHHLGYHELMKFLDIFHHIIEYDVTWWDKGYSLKEFMFYFRKKFLDLDEDEERVYMSMAQNYFYPQVLLPDGTVARFNLNQLSGGENTTVDNTVGHILIVFYEIICGYRKKYGKTISYKAMFEHFRAKFYSDDTGMSHDDTFDFLSDGAQKHSIFEQFGMAIDYKNPQKWKVFSSVVGLTFLGLTCFKEDPFYVYLFDYSKIKDAILFNPEQHDPATRM